MGSGQLRRALEEIYGAALQAVDPAQAITRLLQLEGNTLLVKGERHDLGQGSVFLAGAGKATYPMARAVEEILGARVAGGLIVVKYSHGGELERTRVLEAGHPEPDAAGERAARALLEFLESSVKPVDLLLFLVSGGGSALLPAPVPGITLEEKRETTALLIRSGLNIHEINAIRKHLSLIKGGRLLQHVRSPVVSLLLSDVVGDDPSSIASGPTAADPTTFTQCLEILDRYGLRSRVPARVLDYLERGASADPAVPETPFPDDPLFTRVSNRIVASNLQALEAAARQASRLGFSPLILSSSIEGDTGEVARMHVALAREVLRSGHPAAPPCCLISGGETTVRVRGRGRGGRNQEFALHCARQIADWEYPHILFASLGTDGNDGPTEAAGALALPDTARRARALGLSIRDHLERNDSYTFFRRLGDLIMTGPTRTNVMDLRLVLVGTPG